MTNLIFIFFTNIFCKNYSLIWLPVDRKSRQPMEINRGILFQPILNSGELMSKGIFEDDERHRME